MDGVKVNLENVVTGCDGGLDLTILVRSRCCTCCIATSPPIALKMDSTGTAEVGWMPGTVLAALQAACRQRMLVVIAVRVTRSVAK